MMFSLLFFFFGSSAVILEIFHFSASHPPFQLRESASPPARRRRCHSDISFLFYFDPPNRILSSSSQMSIYWILMKQMSNHSSFHHFRTRRGGTFALLISMAAAKEEKKQHFLISKDVAVAVAALWRLIYDKWLGMLCAYNSLSGLSRAHQLQSTKHTKLRLKTITKFETLSHSRSRYAINIYFMAQSLNVWISLLPLNLHCKHFNYKIYLLRIWRGKSQTMAIKYHQTRQQIAEFFVWFRCDAVGISLWTIGCWP